MTNTRDLSEFGYRELEMAKDLLVAYCENGADFLGDGVAIEFNPSSGKVFMVDEEFNVAMEVNGEVVQWCNCVNCGTEGLANDDDFNFDTSFCDECYKEENPEEFREGYCLGCDSEVLIHEDHCTACGEYVDPEALEENEED